MHRKLALEVSSVHSRYRNVIFIAIVEVIVVELNIWTLSEPSLPND